MGPIPARAGEPPRQTPSPRWSWAYPRSRGGTGGGGVHWHVRWGLSPLARGNLPARAGAGQCQGPIPARAGEPRSASSALLLVWAYPRSRGGTPGVCTDGDLGWGLSPLARGNRCELRVPAGRDGPIPARAGEPLLVCAVTFLVRAYPRSRGGTTINRILTGKFQGLSPLARGNLARLLAQHTQRGPIPARAGEPQP